MSRPAGQFADDAHRILRPVRQRRIAREPLVGHVRVVLDRAQRLDQIDASRRVADGELGSRGCGIQRLRHVDVARDPIVAEVGPSSRLDEVADLQLRLRAVEQGAGLMRFERNRCVRACAVRQGSLTRA